MNESQQDGHAEPSLLKDEYSALRNEIVTRTGIQHQLISIALVASGSLLSIGISATSPTAVILLYPILGMLIAASWKQNDIRIRQVGFYIREKIENQPSTHIGWEHFFKSQKESLATYAPSGIFIITQAVLIIAAVVKAGFYLSVEDVVLLALDIGLLIVTVLIVLHKPSIVP